MLFAKSGQWWVQPMAKQSCTADKRAVWRVTLRGEAIGPERPIGEATIVDIDRLNGGIVSISKS